MAKVRKVSRDEDFSHPETAPRTARSTDGKTTLYRYQVKGVIYAPSKDIAQRRLEASIMLDRAAIVPDTVQTELED